MVFVVENDWVNWFKMDNIFECRTGRYSVSLTNQKKCSKIVKHYNKRKRVHVGADENPSPCLRNEMYQGIIFGAVALLAVIILLSFRKVDERKFDIFLKTLTVVFCAVGFFRFFLSDGFIFVMNGGWYSGTYYNNADVWQSILRWGYFTAYSVLPMAVFFKSRFFKNVASYISMPFAVLSAIFFDDYMVYFLAEQDRGIQGTEGFRYAYFVIELVFAILIPLLMQIKYKHYLNFKDKREVTNFFVGFPLVFVATTPIYVPQSLFGFGEETHKMFGGFHFAWIGVLIAVILALYFAFRSRPMHDRKMLCMFLTFALFFHYNSAYLMGIPLSRLPFQLCNIASYFLLVAMVFNLKKMMQFCYIINITGTILAIAAPTFEQGAISFWTLHYIVEHSLVLIVPLLAFALKLYPRLNKKSMLYAFVGFSSYFLFVFVLGTLLNGYSDVTGETVNYFFMFDTEVAFDFLPFLSFAGEFYFTIGRFECYPMMVLIIYFGFNAIWLMAYGIILLIYKIIDKCSDKPLSRRPWKKAHITQVESVD